MLSDSNSRGASLVVMQSVEHCEGNDLALLYWRRLASQRFWNLVCNPLMGRCSVKIPNIFFDHTLQLLVAENQQLIPSFAANSAQETLTHRVRPRCPKRNLHNLNATCLCQSVKEHSIVAVNIANQIFGPDPIRRGFTELLSDPLRSGTSS
jgi:hypothetical protein